jgi:homoserine kinase type II
MSVFTTVTAEQLSRWLQGYAVGSLVELKGIAAGIENTNYFVTTSHGRYVLTLFERLPAEQLPFYLDLMSHLARHGIPCPAPIADRDNSLFSTLNEKPAAIVTRLAGAPVMAPSAHHCALIGSALADMHVAARTYPGTTANPRGPAWWHETAPLVLPFLDDSRRALLESELAVQALVRTQDLPHGAVHADLFRDNALWDGPAGAESLRGIIDFYFAGIDTLLFDLAVTVNDWCCLPDGNLDPVRLAALVHAYRKGRALTMGECNAWPLMLRAGALRFWLSRLFDFHLPRAGELTHAHDPEHFRRILELRRQMATPLEPMP